MKKFWKREQGFVPETECVPAFYFKGERLIEVAFTEFTSNPDGSWGITKGAVCELGDEADRIIFETPVGCFETITDVSAGRIELQPGHSDEPGRKNVAMGLCRRTLAARAKLEEEVTS